MAGKRTPLHDWHVSHGANMATFGGYEMPLWYPAGMREEHLGVLTRCGMFDTTHMSVLRLTGDDIYKLLQWVFTRDLDHCVGRECAPLTPGRATYGVFLNEAGSLVDDVIVVQLDTDDYLAVVNAGMGEEAAHHILNYIDTCEGSCKVLVSDLSDRVGKIDIQGPLSAQVLKGVLENPGAVFGGMKYYGFKGSLWSDNPKTGMVRLKNGVPILLSKSGYTGEFGFEVFMEPDHLVETWEMLLKAGEPYGILPCGLAARDSLRTGAVLPLSHQDNGNWRYINNPWPLALPYTAGRTSFTKDFLGKQALVCTPPSSWTFPFVGFDVRKVAFTDSPPVVVNGSGKVIGIVLTCVTDVGIGWHEGRIYSVSSPDKPEGVTPKGLSCGFVKVTCPLSLGDRLTLRDRKRGIPVMIVNEIRPDRTARYWIETMLSKQAGKEVAVSK